MLASLLVVLNEIHCMRFTKTVDLTKAIAFQISKTTEPQEVS